MAGLPPSTPPNRRTGTLTEIRWRRLAAESAVCLGLSILLYGLFITQALGVEDKQFAAYSTGVLAHLATIIYVMVRRR